MASGPIVSWQMEGEKVEAVTDFLFLSSKITTDSDCSHDIRRGLLLGRKAVTKLDDVLGSRGITLVTKVPIVKTGLPSGHIWLWELDRKEAEHQKINAFELWSGEDSWASLRQQDKTSQSYGKSTLNTHWKNCCWSWNSSILVIWCEQPTYW